MSAYSRRRRRSWRRRTAWAPNCDRRNRPLLVAPVSKLPPPEASSPPAVRPLSGSERRAEVPERVLSYDIEYYVPERLFHFLWGSSSAGDDSRLVNNCRMT